MTCALEADGNHTIVVSGSGAFASGDFAIEVQRLDSPSGCSTRSFGTHVAGDGSVADADCHRFTATAGDRVRARVRTTSALSPYVEILGPDGIARCTGAEITCSIQQTGTHTILVTDSAPGTRSGGYEVRSSGSTTRSAVPPPRSAPPPGTESSASARPTACASTAPRATESACARTTRTR